MSVRTMPARLARSTGLARFPRIARRRVRGGQPDTRREGARAFLDRIEPVTATEPPGPTIVLLNDCRDQVNFGAQALVEGLLDIIRQRIPNATIVPVPSHWLIDRAHGMSAFVGAGDGMSQPQVKYPQVVDQFEPIADEWMTSRGGPDARAVLERFEGADLVVLNGEGSVYRMNLSAIRELFLAWLAKDRLGVPTVFLNGSVHLTDVVPVLPPMVRKTFRCLDAVAVREARSFQNLQTYAPDVEARLLPDSAFVFTHDAARASRAVEDVRARVGSSRYFCFDPGAMPVDCRGPSSALQRLITKLKADALQAVFVSSAPADSYIESIAKETGSVYVDSLTDFREFMALVDDAEFLISGRYHNPLLAAIMGCPTIAFASTSHKVHGACEMLDGIVGSPYDGTDLLPNLDAIAEQARSYEIDRAAVRARLRATCDRRRTEVMQLGELVRDVLQRAREHA